MSRPGIDSQVPGERPPFPLTPEQMASREKKNPITITFPDGTIGKFDSANEAMEAMAKWREQ